LLVNAPTLFALLSSATNFVILSNTLVLFLFTNAFHALAVVVGKARSNLQLIVISVPPVLADTQEALLQHPGQPGWLKFGIPGKAQLKFDPRFSSNGPMMLFGHFRCLSLRFVLRSCQPM
jgi:hypothetical protein